MSLYTGALIALLRLMTEDVCVPVQGGQQLEIVLDARLKPGSNPTSEVKYLRVTRQLRSGGETAY